MTTTISPNSLIPKGGSGDYEYDGVYQQTAVHGPEDTHITTVYNKVRLPISISECTNDGCSKYRVTQLEYDSLDRMIKMVENTIEGFGETADTNVTTKFEYDLVGNLLILADALEHQTFYEYDKLNRMVRAEDAEAQVTRYVYDANSNLVELINPRQHSIFYAYDGVNRLETTIDADGNVWRYNYDANSNLSETEDPEEVITRFEYDELDRMHATTQNFVEGGDSTADTNVTTRFEYDLHGNLRFIFDPRGDYQTEYRYDDAHRREMVIDAEGGETEFIYDDVNNLVEVVDARDYSAYFEYDDLNRQILVTNQEGHHTRLAYDRLSNLLSVEDGRLHTTTFVYDGMNRVAQRIDALDGEWDYTYDAMGNLLCHNDANGHDNNCYTYDDVYRVLTVTDAEGHVDEYSYDANDNRETWSDGNQHVTTYTYDVLNRLETLTNAEDETTAYEYDGLGNQIYLIEADGIVTRYDYDPLYRLAAVNQNDRPGEAETTDINVDTHYIYDEVGNLLTIIDAEENDTGFEYDGLNRLLKETDADGYVWEYGYDPLSNRTSRIDANGDLTEYSYYPDNQLETISYEKDGTSAAYFYDENNNTVQLDDWLGATSWIYDPLNRVTDVTDVFDRHLGYGYDAVSNRTSLTYADGRTVNYTFYDNDWLESVLDPEENVTHYERDGVGLPQLTTNPNETISTATYDDANRLLTLVNEQISGAAKVNSAFAYTYNEIGHRTEMVAEYGWRNPAVVTSDYTYDGLRRLIRDENSEGVWTDYTFDRVGNRVALTTNDDSTSPRPFDAQTLVYSYSPTNRLLTIVGDTHPRPAKHQAGGKCRLCDLCLCA